MLLESRGLQTLDHFGAKSRRISQTHVCEAKAFALGGNELTHCSTRRSAVNITRPFAPIRSYQTRTSFASAVHTRSHVFLCLESRRRPKVDTSPRFKGRQVPVLPGHAQPPWPWFPDPSHVIRPAWASSLASAGRTCCVYRWTLLSARQHKVNIQKRFGSMVSARLLSCAFHTAAVGSKCSTSWSGLIHKAPWIVVRLAYSSRSVDAKVLMWCYVSRLGRNAMTNGSQRAASLRPSSILYVHTYWAPEAGIRPNRCSALLHAPQGITYHTFHIIAHKRCQTSQVRHRSSRPHTTSIYTHPNSGGWWCLGAEMRLARTQPITFRPNAPRR